MTHDPLSPHSNGSCANCNEPIYMDSRGKVAHCYTGSVVCENGKKIMIRRQP